MKLQFDRAYLYYQVPHSMYCRTAVAPCCAAMTYALQATMLIDQRLDRPRA